MTSLFSSGARNAVRTTHIAALALGFALAALSWRSAHADVVTDWYATASNVTNSNAPSGVFVPRNLAITHLAIYDAVNAVEGRYEPYAVSNLHPPAGTSVDAAAAGAAYAALVALYPSQKLVLDAALKASLSKVPEGPRKIQGFELGRAVGEKIVALRADDGSATDVAYTPLGTPGSWKPTPPAQGPLTIARWPKVRPFFLKSADQFKAPPPLDFRSEAYAREINEVKRLGGVDSTERTADQTAVAIFWVAPTWHPFLEVARQEAERRKLGVVETARLYALVNGLSFDTYVVGYGVKLLYNQQRAATAIREAVSLGNPRIQADPSWLPLIQTPQHPDYVSGHAIQAGSYEKVLQKVFGGDQLSAPSDAVWPAGTVRRVYTSWSQLTREDNDARIWGGIHTRTATDVGDRLGYQIGEYVANNLLKPVAR